MNRPPPLSELSLERFLPSEHALLNADSVLATAVLKRPLSPSECPTPTAKRRMLDIDESASPSRCTRSTSNHRQSHSVRFDAALKGPGSPVRRLDFSPATSTKINHTGTNGIETTPRARPIHRDCYQGDYSMASPAPDYQQVGSLSASGSGVLSTRRPQPRLVFEVVPRTLPSAPDPASEHYPGFEVYRDPHVIVARPSETQPAVSYDDELPEKENCEPPRPTHALPTVLMSPHKPSSEFAMSLAKGKAAMVNTSPYVSLARRIFATGISMVTEDQLDLNANNNFARQAALASDTMRDSKMSSPSPKMRQR
ncbi:hypothetical protein FA15DRAFT_664971 [Coprinopsis marcescibilis]|uniref:Uncharacterized protein n=1 Tax=Coprinopsis marcescibilis TaxID=230819 RepID=A0A5C3L8B7_COPMA|nr:hypothetical protein FA15DRAFT_664971 [Coprinopsis marcescibilis]